MTTEGKTVFVLGAGFTRAFCPAAPLLTDDYDLDALCEKFKEFPRAVELLELAQQDTPSGKVNLERLMTRLDGGMPYDSEQGVEPELRLLLSEVKREFVGRLQQTGSPDPSKKEVLASLARFCIDNRVTCVTFNYDDVLDEALHQVHSATLGRATILPGFLHWHPDGGYGFLCKPSAELVGGYDTGMGGMAMLLLKLHGSVNWWLARGSMPPYAIHEIVHHESWSWHVERSPRELQNIEYHLGPESFIVPPVLTKSTLVEQPILRLVWSRAYGQLREADAVVFVGYSLPLTDMAASFLFRETLREIDVSRINVVTLAEDEHVKRNLVQAYTEVFPAISEQQFDFRGALAWARELTAL